jgi:hypothetical protein
MVLKIQFQIMNQSRLNGHINSIESGLDRDGDKFFRLNIILDGGEKKLFRVHPNYYDELKVFDVTRKIEEDEMKENMWIDFIAKLNVRSSRTGHQFDHIIAINNLFNNQVDYLKNKMAVYENLLPESSTSSKTGNQFNHITGTNNQVDYLKNKILEYRKILDEDPDLIYDIE